MQKNDNTVRMLSKVPREINLFTGLCIVWLNQQGEQRLSLCCTETTALRGHRQAILRASVSSTGALVFVFFFFLNFCFLHSF